MFSDKCSVLHIYQQRPCSCADNNYPYHIDNVGLPVVSCVTDLCVSHDNELKFGFHIDCIVSKAALSARLILKCFQSRDPALLVTAFLHL